MKGALMRRLSIAAIAVSCAALLVSAAPHLPRPAQSCVPPGAILSSQQQDAVRALDFWIERNVVPGWDVVKYGGLVDYGNDFQAAYGAYVREHGMKPGRIELQIRVGYDALVNPFTGEIVVAKAWRVYDVVLTRDCADSDWRVEAKLRSSGSAKGGFRGSTGVPTGDNH